MTDSVVFTSTFANLALVSQELTQNLFSSLLSTQEQQYMYLFSQPDLSVCLSCVHS